MSEWTPAARQELQRYLDCVRASLGETSDDTAEVVEDLRRHVEEEANASHLSVVTEDDVRRITTRLGVPGKNPAVDIGQDRAMPTTLPQTHLIQSGQKGWRMGGLMFFGVVLPAFALGFEWVTGICAATCFDPIPTVFHALLVALVPLINLGTWLALKRGYSPHPQAWGWLNGLALGVAGYFTLLYLPMTPFGLVGIIIYGLGLLPCSPLLAWISTLLLRLRLRRLPVYENGAVPGGWRGAILGLFLLLALNAPVWFTRTAMQWAGDEAPVIQHRGLRGLRNWGDEDILRRACYGRSPGAAGLDPVEWAFGFESISPEQARQLYYRVTGHAFNTVAAPEVRTGRGSFAALDEWTWDADQGGEKVGGRIKGLTLHSSRLDATIEPDAALGYCEWILEFKNTAPVEHEARAQILLPPGGVVSRLTLWVNGEEREAAFAGRGQVREAYQKVAIRQRRDPVLVSTCGPGQVLMQCFPVPRNGGLMKVRIGVTVPLLLVDDAAQGLWRWPSFVERNFSLLEPLRHSIWIRSSQPLTSKCTEYKPGSRSHSLQGQLRETELGSPQCLVQAQRRRETECAWTRDTRAPAPAYIRQLFSPNSAPRPSCVVVVLDRSAMMAQAIAELVTAFEQAPEDLAWGWVVADDEPVWLREPNRKNREAVSSERIRQLGPQGGFDNVPALLAGWDVAVGQSNALVLWLHGPQPVELASVEPLRQRLERSDGSAHLISLQTIPGPNVLLQKLDGLSKVHAYPRLGSLKEDLRHLFTDWSLDGSRWKIAREVWPSPVTQDRAVEATLHLARLWAHDEIIRLQQRHRIPEAVQLAGRYQLVTPVSGAVVLETAQQFAENNLTPAEAETVPSIPEPSVVVLLLAGLGILVLIRRFQP